MNKRVTTTKTKRRAVTTKTKGKARKKVMSITQYVLPLGNGWVVKTGTARAFTVITDTKKEAVTIARKMAQTKHGELVVHTKDGSIEIKESYAVAQ